MMTELEGAILSDILHRGRDTRFQGAQRLRQIPFPRMEGECAGAVYAAIQRLERKGSCSRCLLATRAERNACRSPTPAAVRCATGPRDAARAASVGIDPFRLRAGIWLGLDAAERATVLRAIREEIERSMNALSAYARLGDAIEHASVDLGLRLQKVRLDWLDAIESDARRDETTNLRLR